MRRFRHQPRPVETVGHQSDCEQREQRRRAPGEQPTESATPGNARRDTARQKSSKTLSAMSSNGGWCVASTTAAPASVERTTSDVSHCLPSVSSARSGASSSSTSCGRAVAPSSSNRRRCPAEKRPAVRWASSAKPASASSSQSHRGPHRTNRRPARGAGSDSARRSSRSRPAPRKPCGGTYCPARRAYSPPPKWSRALASACHTSSATASTSRRRSVR
jgi:hypothetical protein